MEGHTLLTAEYLGSIAGIVTLAILLTNLTKRYLGNAPTLSKTPVFAFVALWTAGLTWVAVNVVHSLDGDTASLIVQALLFALASSGLVEVKRAGLKPMEESKTAQRAALDAEINRNLYLLPLLLAGALTVSACAGLRIGTPAPPSGPGQTVSVTPEEINRAAIQLANAGTEILGIVDQALTLAHEVIPPSQLRLDINQAVGDFARVAKSSAQTAKAVLTAESLTALARELAAGVDKVLAALERSTHEGLAKFAGQIRMLAAPIRAALTGGVK